MRVGPISRSAKAFAVAVGVLVLAAPPAWATHVEGSFEGPGAHGGQVRFVVQVVEEVGISVNQFFPLPSAPGAGLGAKTDLGQDCTPIFPPPADALPIVNHAFSDATPPFLVSGSFSEPKRASGTFRITSGAWLPPPGERPRGSICDTGTVSWTASCAHLFPPCGLPPTFSRSGTGAKVSPTGDVTVPMRIGCPLPGGDCRISVTALAVGHEQITLGRARYLVRAGNSAGARFTLNSNGRRLLRRLRRVRANVFVSVTRDMRITRDVVTVRLRAPKRFR
jgi:hypothetical protein